MIWFFERQDSRLHYEVRRQTDGDDYELVITWPDGRQDVERYSECGTLLQRTTVLESRLEADGWQPPLTGPRPGAAARRGRSS